MASNHILVDSSVWIQCFKPGHSAQREHLDRLLADDRVVVCGPVKAEVLSATRSLEDFRKLSDYFEGLSYLSVSDEKIWDRISESRFKLARQGIQESLIDLLIAWTAYEHGVSVWSLDEDFKRIKDEVSFKIYRPAI